MTFVDFYSKLNPKLAESYKRLYLGNTKIGRHEVIHLPTSVRKNFELKPGDELHWYVGSFDVDFPEEELPNLIVIIVKHKEDERRV